MTTMVSTTSVRQIALGNYVNRAAAALPQTASGNIFSVTTGRVILTSFQGVVASALGATVTNLKVTFTPTTGTAQDIASNLAVTSFAAGRVLTLNPTIGSALVSAATAVSGVAPALACGQIYLPVGTMSITTDASNTGTVQWSLTYVPLDAGAAMAAL